MTSDRRIEANRRNASKSTGPRTEEGRQRVSQNARRHGLTQGPAPDRVMHYVSVLLDAGPLAHQRVCREGQAAAMALADAEARLERVREVEFRFLEDCHALDREMAHLQSGRELVTTSHKIFKSIRQKKIGVFHETTVKTTPEVVGREEKIKTQSYQKEMRRLLRYRKEAENHRHKALRHWIAYVRGCGFSETNPTEEPESH